MRTNLVIGGNATWSINFPLKFPIELFYKKAVALTGTSN